MRTVSRSIKPLTVYPSIHPMSAKMEVLDMVIDILVQHEKTLDALIERLENILKPPDLDHMR